MHHRINSAWRSLVLPYGKASEKCIKLLCIYFLINEAFQHIQKKNMQPVAIASIPNLVPLKWLQNKSEGC